jgi:hypothetical protein
MITVEQCQQCRWPKGLVEKIAKHNGSEATSPDDLEFVLVTARVGGQLVPIPTMVLSDGSIYEGTATKADETCPNGHQVWVWGGL